MKREIGWVETQADGTRREISAKVFGGSVYWIWRLRGESEWDETAVPDEAHWEELERLYRNRLQRGQGTEDELAVIVARKFSPPRGRPRQRDPLPSKKPGNRL